jgi:4-carboxymuconolactone decarboxylase
MRTRLWGEQALKGADESLKNFDQGFAKLLNDQLFGEIWTRPGLPTKTRSMITVAVLMALGRPQELRLHMRGALNVGITPEELKEIIVHVSQYSGVPTAIEGIRAFTEVTAPPK